MVEGSERASGSDKDVLDETSMRVLNMGYKM